MPELPEVETTRRGVAPHVLGRTVRKVIIRQRTLRWPISARLDREITGTRIEQLNRRGKYLIFCTTAGNMILHLGMSGSLRVVNATSHPGKHDHVDIVLDNGIALRFTDPRRFGSIHWTRKDPLQHTLLKNLGPEPWDDQFNGDYLFQRSRNRRQAIKQFIMDSHTVVGIGNIYASEALFMAGINPLRAAGRISSARYQHLCDKTKEVLENSLRKGGTSLRDFVNEEGKPGYFQQSLCVYGREGLACVQCKQPVRKVQQGQRSTFYCTNCQH